MVNSTLYCGSPFIKLGSWWDAFGPAREDLTIWPQLRGRCVIGTRRGRTAIRLACRLLGLGPGHEILFPAYNCGTELDALLHSGATVVGYRVSSRCDIDLADLKARKTSRTRAVYVIHYFGWEQPLLELRRWCDDQGLLLIEDCALALFSQGASGPLGLIGDAAIYSLPKTLGLNHGGLLSLSAAHTMNMPDLAPVGLMSILNEIWNSIRGQLLSLQADWIHCAFRAVRNGSQHIHCATEAFSDLPDMPSNYYFNSQLYENRALHHRAWKVATAQPWKEIVRRRQLNYMQLIEALAPVPGVTLLYPELPTGTCPLSLPLLVSQRDACVAAFKAHGIDAFPWWAGFHRHSLDWNNFPDACLLKHNLLTLPIHQDMDEARLHHVIEICRGLPFLKDRNQGAR